MTTTHLQFPLTLRMKLIALAPQFFVEDANQKPVAFIKQKLFKLKEAINVFADETQKEVLYTITADRIIDFSARYNLKNAAGLTLGSVKRYGMRSLWRAQYDIYDGERIVFTISEESVLTRFFDNIFSQIPLLGALSGYIFQPSYIVKRESGEEVMRLSKQPALWEGIFKMEQLVMLSHAEQESLMLSLFMTVLLERQSG
ncbi:MAG: hypothetical protein ABL923_12110 [Burkholderiaceae bacterium]